MDYYKLKILNNKKKIIFLVILLILGALTFYYFYYYRNNNEEVEILLDNNKKEDTHLEEDDKLLFVDIKGYVSIPGVYSFKVSDNARINDLILKAGGLKKDADTSILNLSKKLEDEMTVIIYSKSEVENFVKTQESLASKLEVCEMKLKNNACISQDENKISDDNKIININTASKEELMTLTGIGESKALAIIKYRESNPFQNIKDIMNVDGIGESLFEGIKDNIKI